MATKELVKENTQEECLRTRKEAEKDGATKKSKDIQKIWQSSKLHVFPDHIPVLEMKNILKKQISNNVQYIKGALRINPRHNNCAYISMVSKERDLLINGIIDRNRALDGDLVVARIHPEKDWQTLANGTIQKTGTVVCILDQVHPRKVIGYLAQHERKHKPYILIKPKDPRIPLIRVHPKSLPRSYHRQPEIYDNMIFLVVINHWVQPSYALG